MTLPIGSGMQQVLNTCSKCSEILPEEAFPWRTRGKRRHTQCSKCFKGYSADHYRRNKLQAIARASKRNPKARKDGMRLIFDYLLTHPCVKCGQSNPLALEFDHRDPKTKTHCVVAMYRYGEDAIMSEIAKCDVLCGSCHNIKTHSENKTFRFSQWEEHNLLS
jgi:5-methylcytosine-specific restriction endonuclease McrA